MIDIQFIADLELRREKRQQFLLEGNAKREAVFGADSEHCDRRSAHLALTVYASK